MIDNSKSVAMLRAAGCEVFQDRRNDAQSRAVDCLEGKTYFFSEGTRRFNASRILACQLSMSGAFLRVTESTAANFEKTRRVVRVVYFDVWGRVVWRPKLEDSKATQAAAEKQFWAWLETFNPAEYYASELARRAARLKSDAAAFSKAATVARRLAKRP